MITLLREEYDHPDLSHSDIVNTVEEILKIRDLFLTVDTYETSVDSRNLRLNQQFQVHNTKINNETDFYATVNTKIQLDSNDNLENFPVTTMFDHSGLKRAQFVTYVHFNLKPRFNEKEISIAVKKLLTKIAPGHNVVIFFITRKVSEYQHMNNEAYEREISRLNSNLKRETNINILVRTLESYNSETKNYTASYFPISTKENNVYLLNKILTARRTLVQMAKARNYQGQPGYIYYDNFSGRFGHFKMNLQARLDLARTSPGGSTTLKSQNYFDVPLSIPDRSYSLKEPAVYMHFLLAPNVNDYGEYCKLREPEFRTELGIGEDGPLHIILVVNKKQGAKTMIEKIGDRLHSKLSLDIVLLDKILFNPLDNVSQPKFRLIKKRTSEYTRIVEHYGSAEDIPRIKSFDPVNKFYGGEMNDIYEIIRPGSIKINDEKDTMLNIDVAYRIVRGS